MGHRHRLGSRREKKVVRTFFCSLALSLKRRLQESMADHRLGSRLKKKLLGSFFVSVTVRQPEDEAFPRLVTDAAYARQVSASTSRSSPGFFGFDCSRARDFQSDEDRLDCHHEQL